MLKGQKLQGVLTAEEVYDVISSNMWHEKFPLFTTVHWIASGGAPVERILEYKEVAKEAAAFQDSSADEAFSIVAQITNGA